MQQCVQLAVTVVQIGTAAGRELAVTAQKLKI